MTFYGLNDEGERMLAGNLEGLIGWYYTTVKLSLEVRGGTERFSKNQQLVRLAAYE